MMAEERTGFPVSVRVAAASIDGIHTDVAVVGFSNCVVVLITQLSSIGSIIQAVSSYVSNSSSNGAFDNPDSAADQLDADPDIPVDIKFVLGNASTTTAASIYQVLAMQIAQQKHKQNPLDGRPLVVGIGLRLAHKHIASSLSEYDGDDGSTDALAEVARFSATIEACAALVSECHAW
ncbi:hypothetical protein GQ54DRAFT_82261 [Martensiomyces pterosporus]|nr:hypothetical protein GQ54DRAFT_82261 [Martensiomyces pterosporus]